MPEFGKPLRPRSTPIPGLVIWDLPVHGDARGWFKENWQQQKMVAAGAPDFGPIQNNISFNDAVGTTRGIHAEPWDKWVSIATGKVFGAWVDLREGETFGTVFTAELDASHAIFVPRGVGNSYQTLEPDTAYVYLVNDHWSPTAEYTFLNLADESVSIDWPIPLGEALVSPKDRDHPRLADVRPMSARRTLVLGAGGQLGRALRLLVGEDGRFDFASRDEIDISSPSFSTARAWSQYDTIINAAAYTAVDVAETEEGRRAAWVTNVDATIRLAQVANAHNLTLVHVSSDYVFDGTASEPYLEDANVAPLGVYGQTKAAADAVVAAVLRHYIVRTSWVIGQGNNFVRTMESLALRGIDPDVVDDQIGRPTFAEDLARGILHLLEKSAPHGVYNVTNSGPLTSWFGLAREIFGLMNHDELRVTATSSSQYASMSTGPMSPRPAMGALSLEKLSKTGWTPPDWRGRLREYLRG